MSLFLFVSSNRQNLGFDKIFENMLNQVQLDICEFLADPTNGYQIYVPVLNSLEGRDVTTKLDIGFINKRFELGVEHMADLNHLRIIPAGSGIKIGLFDFNYPDKNLQEQLSRIATDNEQGGIE